MIHMYVYNWLIHQSSPRSIFYDMKETANTHENFETITSRLCNIQIVYTVHWTWFYKSGWGKLGNPPDWLLLTYKNQLGSLLMKIFHQLATRKVVIPRNCKTTYSHFLYPNSMIRLIIAQWTSLEISKSIFGLVRMKIHFSLCNLQAPHLQRK
jgi:hypothetical protein